MTEGPRLSRPAGGRRGCSSCCRSRGPPGARPRARPGTRGTGYARTPGVRWTDGRTKRQYGAFGLIGTTFRELERKTLIFFERAVPISPINAWYGRALANRRRRAVDGRAGQVAARLDEQRRVPALPADRALAAREGSDRPKRCELAHALQWERGYKWLTLARLLGQRGRLHAHLLAGRRAVLALARGLVDVARLHLRAPFGSPRNCCWGPRNILDRDLRSQNIPWAPTTVPGGSNRDAVL